MPGELGVIRASIIGVAHLGHGGRFLINVIGLDASDIADSPGTPTPDVVTRSVMNHAALKSVGESGQNGPLFKTAALGSKPT